MPRQSLSCPTLKAIIISSELLSSGKRGSIKRRGISAPAEVAFVFLLQLWVDNPRRRERETDKIQNRGLRLKRSV